MLIADYYFLPVVTGFFTAAPPFGAGLCAGLEAVEPVFVAVPPVLDGVDVLPDLDAGLLVVVFFGGAGTSVNIPLIFTSDIPSVLPGSCHALFLILSAKDIHEDRCSVPVVLSSTVPL